MVVGSVAEIWRYPVKSLAGERVGSAFVDQLGVVGDRAWAFINSDDGDVAWGKSSPGLMNLTARYLDAHPGRRVFQNCVPPVEIEFVDGVVLGSDDDSLNDRVSSYIGCPVKLSPLQPPARREHYRWSRPPDERKLRTLLGLGKDEPMPDLSTYDGELMATLGECFSPPGTYHDTYPVHLISTATLHHMSSVTGEDFDRRRFRPNLYLKTAGGLAGLAEFDWIGRSLQIGDAEFRVAVKTLRCSMPMRMQHSFGLDQNLAITKAVHQIADRFLGVYLNVSKQGGFSVGDQVRLVD